MQQNHEFCLAWAKFKKLSSILTASGASYHMKGKIFMACVHAECIDIWD